MADSSADTQPNAHGVRDDREHDSAGGSQFSLMIAALLVGLIVGYRVFLGAGIGLIPDDLSSATRFHSGAVYNIQDNLQYASWARQARDGRFMCTNLYTTEPHRPVIVLPVVYAVGRLAGLTGVPSFTILIVLGIVSAGFIVWAAYWIARQVGLSEIESRITCVLVAFGSGATYPTIYWLEKLLGMPLRRKMIVGADEFYYDALFFTNALIYPYIHIAYAMMFATILLYLFLERQQLTAPMRAIGMVAVLMIVSMLALTHPYEYLVVNGTFLMFAAMSLRNPCGTVNVKARWTLVIAVNLVGGLVLAYHLWVASLPVWYDVIKAALHLPFGRWTWILGWGVPLPFALWGIHVVWTRPGYQRARWFAMWLGVLFVLLVVIGTSRTKVSSGCHLPVCLLGSVGFLQVWTRIKAAPPNGWRQFATAAMVVCVLLTFASSANLLRRMAHHRPTLWYDPNFLSTIKHLPGNAAQPATVLTDLDAGRLLPTLAGARVYVGNHYLSRDIRGKMKRLFFAGVQANLGNKQYIELQPEVGQLLSQLLRVERFDFVLLRDTAPANAILEKYSGVEVIHSEGDWRLYRVVDPELAIEAEEDLPEVGEWD